MTTPERWAKIERLYHEALACDATSRASFLMDACAGDDALRREVESLLAHDGGAAFLSTPAVVSTLGPQIEIGQAIGPYVISAQIGEGGMGRVYRARDTKLGRDVAIKIVSRAFAADAELLERFEREAQVLASFNHPHIGAIYGLEEADGVRALVLELVDGKTLADKLTEAGARGLPIPEALAIARQIADALEAAHERGIVHRDLKPANISITAAGTVKVLDFGLAKIIGTSSPELSHSPTITVDGTGTGVILGTAPYMSPEQARGLAVDRRTDIWAFGCVLYELLAGRPAFVRGTASDTIAALLTDEPDWAALPRTTPSHVLRVLKRCLAKDPTLRQRDVGDARLELADGEDPQVINQDRWAFPLRLRGRTAAAAGTVAVMLAAMGYALGAFGHANPARPTGAGAVRFSISPPTGNRFFHNVATTFLSLSPDGSQLAFIAETPSTRPMIWLRPISALEARALPGTTGATSVFWSPDGRSLAFFAGSKLKRIDLPDGAALPLCDAPSLAAFGTWGRNGTILFASFMGDAIFSVPSEGGRPEEIVTRDASTEERVVWPSYLPDGKHFLYLSQRPNSTSQLMLGERRRAPRPIVPALSNAQWVDPDYIVFAQEGVLVAQRFDLASGRIVGAPISIAEPVDRFLSTGRAMFTTSPNGTIAYHSFANVARLAWFDRTGTEVGTVGAPGNYLTVHLSPDGGTALFERTQPGLGTWDVWTSDLARNVEKRLTSDAGSEAFPIWTPDGRSILFAHGNAELNLARKHLDTNVEDQLLSDGTEQRRPMDVSPDGRTLLYSQRAQDGTFDVFMLPLSGPATPSPLFASSFNELTARFSPDGRVIALISNESGRAEVYVAPFPPNGNKTPVSAGVTLGADGQGGFRWRRDGRELFYMSADHRIMSVPIRTTPTLQVGGPSPLFTLSGRAWEDFDVSADGKRFLAVVPQVFAGEQPLTVILNWIAEVRR